MVDTPQSSVAALVKEHMEEGRKYAAKEEGGRGPLYDKDRKFLGIIPAQSQATRGILYGTWLAVAEATSSWWQGQFEKLYKPAANTLFKNNPTRAGRVATTAAAVTTVSLAAAPFINDIFAGSKKHRKERDLTAKKIRALLEEVTGKSGPDSLMKVSAEQNEVLFVQRKRYEADMQQSLKDDIMGMSLSVAPTAVTSVVRNNPALRDKLPQFIGGNGAEGSSGHGMTAIISGLAPQIGEMVNEESKNKYNLSRQPYSALEMIVHLDEQLRDVDFSKGKFTDSFTLPEKGGSKSLAGYISEIFKQHQRDMENINPEHAPLRSALDSQLEEISKDIAEAIKRGDIAPLAIARLAGEGMVIKNRGRSLAKPSDVRTSLQKMSSNALNYLQVDSADYYGEASFSRNDLKTALNSLNGEDKLIFAALIPDDILKEAGLPAEEIQKIRDTSAKAYESKLAQIVTGLAGYDDQKLGDLGLAKEEIEQLRKVAKEVRSKGQDTIHEFRAKPTDPAGIERVVTNAVVNRVQGSKEYLGNLIRTGQQLMDATPTPEVNESVKESASKDAAESKSSGDAAHEIADEAATKDVAESASADEEKDEAVAESKGSFASKEDARREAAENEEAVQMSA